MNHSLLVLYAHGSRDPRWRQTFESLTETIAAELGGNRVALAYLEFCPPTLVEMALRASSNGIGKLRILPMFLAGGAHVSRDIPREVEKVKERLPEMEVEVLPAIGENARLQRLLRDMAREEALRLELEARAPAGSTV